MSEKENIAQDKFEEAKGIVNDSHCKITDYYDEYRMFRLNAKSQDGTTVMITCKVIPSAITGDIHILYDIYVDGDIVYDVNIGLDKQDYGIVEFHKIIDGLDEEATKKFTGGLQ